VSLFEKSRDRYDPALGAVRLFGMMQHAGWMEKLSELISAASPLDLFKLPVMGSVVKLYAFL